MIQRTVSLLSKRITIPRLSPTHTKVRILRFEVEDGAFVSEYDPLMVVECSSDLVTEAFRDEPEQTFPMIIETQEEGTVNLKVSTDPKEWLLVGTEIGTIDDEDPVDGEWMWQAYHHSEGGNGKDDGPI